MSCVALLVKNGRELENIIGGTSLHCIKYLLLITYFQIIQVIWILLKKKKKKKKKKKNDYLVYAQILKTLF